MIINKRKKTAHLFHLIIDPSYQQQGYAIKLISHAEKVILANKINEITINVMKKNQIARNLYKSAGFTDTGVSKAGRIKMLKNLNDK